MYLNKDMTLLAEDMARLTVTLDVFKSIKNNGSLINTLD